MYCDNKLCKKDIIKDVNDTTPVFLLCFDDILYWFCCSECRNKFIECISIDAIADKAGHIDFKEVNNAKTKRS